ncbi:MAG: LytTR family transcriptional regulator DNA-binding domain-containing protein [Bacteroidales bacterium]|nr:LytTR family transcriptional regulator DNA-binding domain-containing protein [Bacteroidales bacterium]
MFIANDNTFLELLKTSSFYTDIVFSVTMTFGIGFYLNFLNEKLDKDYSWYATFKARLIRQLFLGVLIPLFVAMASEIFYLYAIGITFAKSSILNLELPLAFIFLVLLNLISFAGYLFIHKQKETIILKEQIIVSPPKSIEYITVLKGFTEERIELSKCAIIMTSDKMLWLQTYSGEKYRLQGNLEEWEEKLKYSNFYRINRQYLVAFKAIQSVENTETRKLKVNFIIPAAKVYISKPNVASFRQWWKQ